LEGPANIEKLAALPAEWLNERYTAQTDRDHYRSIHLLGEIPAELKGFEGFWNARRERLRDAITAVLNESPSFGAVGEMKIARAG
jgi:hypothetical protein